jgi:esterase/lipase superfamily enzyme
LKYSASLWLAISAGHQHARAKLMNERYIKWYTPYLSREFEMLVFREKRGLPLILFPTSGARYYENKDFRLVAPVAWYIDNGRVTVYCPNAIDLEVSTINQFIQPIGCARTTRTKT